jgi:transposase InsO family protein
VLVELGLVEQRHKAVLEVLGGAAVTDVALRNGVSRQTVHRWLRRYGAQGLAGLVDLPTRPETCPHQMASEVEAQVVELRRKHPSWGPRTLRHRLEQQGIRPLPGRSSIYRCLVRHQLVEPKKRRRRREDYRRWERSHSMELWQMDVMGGVKLQSGQELSIITGIDDHSRFCVLAHLVPRATARPVCEALADALRAHGVPDQVLTDNAKVFTNRFGPGDGEVLFDRICRENGIRHLLTAPHSPTTTGKVERFHKTVRSEFLLGRVFADMEEAQAELDAWVTLYNSERPHQGIGMASPQERFALRPLETPEPPRLELEEEEPAFLDPARRLSRRVSQKGKISLATFSYHVGSWLAGETVEVQIAEGLVQIFHREVLVATHARRHALDAEPCSWQRPPQVRRALPPTVGVAVMRKVDPSGHISFAGTAYRVGNDYIRQEVEVRLVGDSVQISRAGRLLRTHAARHDKQKEHGAFANPGGRPRKKQAS